MLRKHVLRLQLHRKIDYVFYVSHTMAGCIWLYAIPPKSWNTSNMLIHPRSTSSLDTAILTFSRVVLYTQITLKITPTSLRECFPAWNNMPKKARQELSTIELRPFPASSTRFKSRDCREWLPRTAPRAKSAFRAGLQRCTQPPGRAESLTMGTSCECFWGYNGVHMCMYVCICICIYIYMVPPQKKPTFLRSQRFWDKLPCSVWIPMGVPYIYIHIYICIHVCVY